MPVEVEANAPARAAAVRRLLERAVGPGDVDERVALHQPDADEPRLRRSLVAIDGDGSVVGVGTAMASARHPVFHHVAVDVDPDRPSGPVGTALLDGLAAAMAAAGSHRRWMAVTDAGDDRAEAFLVAAGFRRVVTSRSGRVPVAAVTSAAPPPDPDLVAVTAVDWSDDVVALYEELYDEAHWWTPYVRFARGVPWASFVGEPVPGTTFVAADLLGRPVAVVSVHVDAPTAPGRLFLPPAIVRHGARRPDAPAVLAALLHRSVAAAAAAVPQLDTMAWEVDDTAPELGVALARFPLAVERVISVWTTPHLPVVP